MFATEAHRPMSSFKEAVEHWNQRTKEDGWISSYAPTLECPECQHRGAIISTIYGQSKATCGSEICRHTWPL